MPTNVSPFARAFAAAALFGTLAVASPTFAAGKTSSSDMKMEDSGSPHKKMSAEDMAEHVETRIQNLHDKLKVTSDQESQWNDVAQAMRDSESNTRELIMQRHQEAKAQNAVQDLESYQKIAQAHADGLGKVISAFQSFYESLSPDQQKNADDVFNRFEGRGGFAKASAHKKGDMAGHSSKSAPAADSDSQSE